MVESSKLKTEVHRASKGTWKSVVLTETCGDGDSCMTRFEVGEIETAFVGESSRMGFVYGDWQGVEGARASPEDGVVHRVKVVVDKPGNEKRL